MTAKSSKRRHNSDSEKEYNSDNLDASDTEKRPKKRSPRKKAKPVKHDSDSDIQVVGEIVQAPKTGRVPPGQISRNTLDFLRELRNPDCNDREWFKLHEPVYRLAEQEWKDFVEAFTDTLSEIDDHIPHLPPKDVIHRIYRDIRFSNDKTPYKTALSASFSRSGRKGIFAHYHIAIKPGGESIIAAGAWCPGKNELATIRSNIQRDATRLRQVISDSEFVKYFGDPKPQSNNGRNNIFGRDDELKVAPKGVDKSDPNIDLLKCRSFAVAHYFTDDEVLAEDFKEKLGKVARVMQPLVHCLNDMMTLQDSDDDDDS